MHSALAARWLVGAAALIAIVSGARSSGAQDVDPLCSSAFEKAQISRDQKRYLDARQAMTACSAETCPDSVRGMCLDWVRQIDLAMPSIVVIARTSDGKDIAGATVRVDTNKAAPTDGTAFALDPGPHTLRFEAPGFLPMELPIVVAEGEKARVVTAKLAPRSDTGTASISPPEKSYAPPISAIVLGATGIASLAVFGTLAATGMSALGDLRDGCGAQHACTQEEVDEVRTRLIVGDVFLGVGATALAAGLIVWIVDAAATPSDTFVATPEGFGIRFQ